MAAAYCAEAGAPFYANTFEKYPSAATLGELGRLLFFDPKISASGKMACASCHDPNNAFAPSNDLAVQRGGADGRRFGVRAVPSLMYAQNVPPFTEHYVDDDGDDSVDQGPAGGRTWDGRAQSAHQQAMLPLLSPFEMANSSAASVVIRVEHSSYAAKFRAAFGEKIFDATDSAFKGILLALETYQQCPGEFYPYSSKYDAYLRHEARLSPQEMRGLELFNNPEKGDCARCHPSAMRRGALPQFTDFGFAAIGVPRNSRIPANADPKYFDLGLCGPLREDLVDKTEYCGFFRTPTLRNVARRRVFFHNGVFHGLEQAVRFYAARAQPYDDLPSQFQDNVDVQTVALADADIADLVAFLRVLSDGYEPGKAPAARRNR
jgi:cytochrome c peroxidase